MEYYRNIQLSQELEEAAARVQQEVTAAFEEAERELELMRQAESVAAERNISVLRVDTNTQNMVTQKLFPKLGYKLSGETELGFRVGLRFLCYEKRIK